MYVKYHSSIHDLLTKLCVYTNKVLAHVAFGKAS
jgi:hypothetical protein